MESIVYSLQGKSLEIAKRIHEANLESQGDFADIEAEVAEYRYNLIQKAEEKHGDTFRALFEEMSAAICVPVKQLREYHLDLTYMESHSLAFLKEGPVDENVVVLDVEQTVFASDSFE